MKAYVVSFFLAVMMLSSAAFAVDLDTARNSGLVGERPDGYIGSPAASPSGDVQTLISSINAQRKAEYQRIAASNGQSIDVVQKLAGAKLIERAGSGQYVMTPSGQWVKK